jgi:hypothetical protein
MQVDLAEACDAAQFLPLGDAYEPFVPFDESLIIEQDGDSW